MGLFEKKYCSICGEKIAFLGNKKLADGNLCKNCCSKLSPRFSERKESTVEQIREQLAYREANKQRLISFSPKWTYGLGDEKLYIDTRMKAIVITDQSLTKDNPDIIDIADMTGCSYDVRQSRFEVKYRAADGRTCSYNPAQYRTDYNFFLTVTVNHPYFSEIEFKINDDSVSIEPVFSVVNDPNRLIRPAAQGQDADKKTLIPPTVCATAVDPARNEDYVRMLSLTEGIKEVLLKFKDAATVVEKPVTAVTCPHCGAPTIPDANGRCEFCMGAIS